jgi:hypothetical protein
MAPACEVLVSKNTYLSTILHIYRSARYQLSVAPFTYTLLVPSLHRKRRGHPQPLSAAAAQNSSDPHPSHSPLYASANSSTSSQPPTVVVQSAKPSYFCLHARHTRHARDVMLLQLLIIHRLNLTPTPFKSDYHIVHLVITTPLCLSTIHS